MSEVAELDYPEYHLVPGTTQDQRSMVLAHYTMNQLTGFRAATLILAVLGLLGNLLVVLVILSRRRWRFANSMFILNIAIANLFICTLTLPLLTRALFDLSWSPAPQFCQLSGFLDNTAFACSSWSLALGSVERLFLVVFPMRHRQLMNYQRAVMISFLIWALSIILSVLPILGWNSYVYSPVTFSCGIDPSPTSGGIHGYYFLVYLVVVLPGPLLISTFSYSYVLFNLRTHYTIRPRGLLKPTRSRSIPGADTSTQQPDPGSPVELNTDIFGSNIQEILKTPKQRKKNIKIVIPMILITCAFMLCFMPNVVVGFDIIANPGKENGQPKLKMIEYLIIHFLLLGNSAMNPIIFTMCSPKFRSGGRIVIIVLFERLSVILIYVVYVIFYAIHDLWMFISDSIVKMANSCCSNGSCVRGLHKYDSLNDVVIKVTLTNSNDTVHCKGVWGDQAEPSRQQCMLPLPPPAPQNSTELVRETRNNEFDIDRTKEDALQGNQTSETML